MFTVMKFNLKETVMPKQPRLTMQDYVNVANERGLVFVGRVAPPNLNTTTRWQCRLTGKILNKKYSSVKVNPFGSTYQRRYYDTLKEYKSLAKRLDIEFLYEEGHESKLPSKKTKYQLFPPTTKDVSYWRGPSGKPVGATFHQLAYGDKIPDDVANALGISPFAGREVEEHA
jgi:hypothetical protein